MIMACEPPLPPALEGMASRPFLLLAVIVAGWAVFGLLAWGVVAAARFVLLIAAAVA